MKDIIIYNVLRLGIFLASFSIVAGLWAAVNGGRVDLLWTLIIAFVVSGIVSYFALYKQRDKFAQKVQAGASKVSRKVGRASDSEVE